MRRERDPAPRRQWPPPGHEADRNGEPCEDDWSESNLVLWVIVLAGLAVIIGGELLVLGIIIGR